MKSPGVPETTSIAIGSEWFVAGSMAKAEVLKP